MTPEQMSAITLGELEALADRAAKALSVLREAQALMGGVAVAQPSAAPINARPPTLGVISAPPPQWTPSELAERERLRRLATGPELPEEIERLER